MVDKSEVSATQDVETHHDSKQKKKRNKLIDLTLKELPQSASSDVKFEYICQKYYELYQDQKENSSKNKQFEQSIQQTIVTFLLNSTLGKPIGSISSILELLIFYNCGLSRPNSTEHAIA
ncbi:unnamed protein product [Schistosoma rodhaini]|uniref:Uncharacterized protein n=1 Tax=Schistosoma rodhaini TaxID=6188 RepID=A0AA85GAA8_9TREM|nr:unnamed protein product [Schistosoma rodhaini]CAH8624617.1 unnamed protein product [Schistosoma rodhaini]